MTRERLLALVHEARAALAGGKVLHEVRIGMRREDREFFVTLKGPAMHLTGLKLPVVVTEPTPEMCASAVFRMRLIETAPPKANVPAAAPATVMLLIEPV